MTEQAHACASEGELPALAAAATPDDTGIAARLAKRLMAWTPPDDAGKPEAIRPGQFTAAYLRDSGVRHPILVKADQFSENPQLGVSWPKDPDKMGNGMSDEVTVEALAKHVGASRPVDTWDVMKQSRGPAWTLAQWLTYWHARQEASVRPLPTARGAGRAGAPAGSARGAAAVVAGGGDSDEEGGEVVDSIVGMIARIQPGERPHNQWRPAPAGIGISPDQAQRLLDAEYLPLNGSALAASLFPPPAVQGVDLIRLVERSLDERQRPSAAAHITPQETLHVHMTPKDCFTDFRQAPGGAATWLYVLAGRRVAVLLPPTLHNRRLFLAWGLATRANHPSNVLQDVFLAEHAEGAVKVEVKANQALVIPCGWLYALATPRDSISLGCFFWHPYALGDVARALCLQAQLRLKERRFTGPVTSLLWYSGIHYARQLRDKHGLLPFRAQRPGGSASGARQGGTSEASLTQPRASPYLRGVAGAGAGGRGGAQRGGTPQGTPPLLGLPGPAQAAAAALGSPASRPAAAAKRGRQELEGFSLGEAALPLDALGGAGGASSRPEAPAGKAGGAAGGKRLRPNASRASTPGAPAAAGAGAAAANGSATPCSLSRGAGARPGALGGGQPSASSQSGPSWQAGSGLARSAQQQGQQGGSGQRSLQPLADEDDEGECHTSPVRRPEPAVAAGEGGARMGWGPAGQGAGPAKPGLKIRIRGREQRPIYSPVLAGQPQPGDLDSLPPHGAGQPRGVTPPAAAGASGADADAAAAAAAGCGGGHSGSATPRAAGSTVATPGRLRISLKRAPLTPTAALAAQQQAAAWADAGAGGAAAAPGAAQGSGVAAAVAAGAPASAVRPAQRRVVLEPTSDEEEEQVAAAAAAAAVAAAAPAAAAALPPLHQQPPQPQPQRRLSDGGRPAPAPAASGKVLRFRMPTPSPKLAPQPAPGEPGEPPRLALGTAAALGAPAGPQADAQPLGQQAVIPQLDGAADWPEQQQHHHHHHHQQQQGPWDSQQQRLLAQQASLHAAAAAAAAWAIPQVDGAGDEPLPGSSRGGPVLVLQPAAPGSGSGTAGAAGAQPDAPEHQQPQQQQRAVVPQPAGAVLPAPAMLLCPSAKPPVARGVQTGGSPVAADAAAAPLQQAAAQGSSGRLSSCEQQAAVQQQQHLAGTEALGAGQLGAGGVSRAGSSAPSALASPAGTTGLQQQQQQQQLAAGAGYVGDSYGTPGAGGFGSVMQTTPGAPTGFGSIIPFTPGSSLATLLASTATGGLGPAPQPMPAAAAPAPPQAMLPPQPTKLSVWELCELPAVLEQLQEQLAEKTIDLPPGLTDPDWVVQQLAEAIREAQAAEQQAPGEAPPCTKSEQQQQQRAGLQLEAAERAAAWVAACGPLLITPLSAEEMGAQLAEACRQGGAQLQGGALAEGGALADASTEVVGEHDPAGAASASSLDRSAGSLGAGQRGPGPAPAPGAAAVSASVAANGARRPVAPGAAGARRGDAGGAAAPGAGGPGGSLAGAKRGLATLGAQQARAAQVKKAKRDLFKR